MLKESLLKLKYNHLFLFLFVLIFINTIALPKGLLYTTLASPLLYFWLVKNGQKNILTKFILVTLPFVVAHLTLPGLNHFFYFRSYLLAIAVYISLYAFYHILRTESSFFESVMERLIFINFFLAMIGLLLRFTPYRSLMWFQNEAMSGTDALRFQMFTYEPSYYATLILPLVAYAIIKYFAYMEGKDLVLFLFSIIPMFMALSFGVISMMVLSLGMVLSIYLFRQTIHFFQRGMISVRVLYLGGIMLLFGLFFMINADYLAGRTERVLSGADVSANIRVYYAYQVAHEIITNTNPWFGSGFGQIKVFGREIMNSIPGWGEDYAGIPCALASLMATLGLVGAALKLGLVSYLFFRTKVYENYYRLSLFIFIFLYQFTGSFLLNVAELAIWIMAFSNVTERFNVRNFHKAAARETL